MKVSLSNFVHFIFKQKVTYKLKAAREYLSN